MITFGKKFGDSYYWRVQVQDEDGKFHTGEHSGHNSTDVLTVAQLRAQFAARQAKRQQA